MANPESKRTIKVLQVVWGLQTGGLERVVLDLIKRSPNFGVKPSVAALNQAGDLAPELKPLGVNFQLLGKKEGLDFSLSTRLRQIIKKQNIDLVHAHNSAPALYAGLACLLTRRPLITTMHGASFDLEASYHWVSRLGALLSRKWVCVSRDALEASRRVDRIPRRKLRVVYNGVDLARFSLDNGVRPEMRRSLGLSQDDYVFISVGRLSAEKDCTTLFKALTLAAAQGAPIKLLMVGDGPEGEAYQSQARNLDPEGRIQFLGRRSDIPQLLAAADAFALSSLSEGISIAILEAMAASIPVAATAVGGNPELVLPNQTGLLVPAQDPKALAGAMLSFAENRDAAREMGRQGRALVEKNFSLDAMVSGYRDLYEQVLA